MAIPDPLSQIISEDTPLNLIEPNLYSVYPSGERPGAYDQTGASTIYDTVACNGLYNRLMWGYSIKRYACLCDDALSSSPDGWILDLACGSLAFTAANYVKCPHRPVVFLDQSLNLLRKGKSRLGKLRANNLNNFFFVHADALALPFRAEIFSTVISLNLLHCLCLEDVKKAVQEIKRVLPKSGNFFTTTLVLGRRWSNRYLNLLAGSGMLVSRGSDELISVFEALQMPVSFEINGNLAFFRSAAA